MMNVVGTPEKTVAVDGEIEIGPGGLGGLGAGPTAPLPQAVTTAATQAASASCAARRRIEATNEDSLADGATALILAAYSGQGPVGELLLEKRAEPNNAKIGYTALHAAVLIHRTADLPAHFLEGSVAFVVIEAARD